MQIQEDMGVRTRFQKIESREWKRRVNRLLWYKETLFPMGNLSEWLRSLGIWLLLLYWRHEEKYARKYSNEFQSKRRLTRQTRSLCIWSRRFGLWESHVHMDDVTLIQRIRTNLELKRENSLGHRHWQHERVNIDTPRYRGKAQEHLTMTSFRYLVIDVHRKTASALIVVQCHVFFYTIICCLIANHRLNCESRSSESCYLLVTCHDSEYHTVHG